MILNRHALGSLSDAISSPFWLLLHLFSYNCFLTPAEISLWLFPRPLALSLYSLLSWFDLYFSAHCFDDINCLALFGPLPFRVFSESVGPVATTGSWVNRLCFPTPHQPWGRAQVSVLLNISFQSLWLSLYLCLSSYFNTYNFEKIQTVQGVTKIVQYCPYIYNKVYQLPMLYSPISIYLFP